MTKNYLIAAYGRGASYAYMLTCDEDEVTSRCHITSSSGFDVFVYEIILNPLGKNGFDPAGSTPLKRIWHLYDAHDEFKQMALDVINQLDTHSKEASVEYLNIMISEFQRELDVLKGGQNGKALDTNTQGQSEVTSDPSGCQATQAGQQT